MTKEQLKIAEVLLALKDPAQLLAMAAMIGASGEESGDDVSELICYYRNYSADIINEAAELLDNAIIKQEDLASAELVQLAKAGIDFINYHLREETA